ncbi:DTW domain-containing protein [Shewanella psychropiezotolerans]|uniref:tRNA-uridine aminocarboxypropyltransferase n=1 Tax=Shewanella psychropiezotolerans TaxID=2593655 RepID=A0ABX5WZ57_9GAMM|nr:MULTISPECIES: tRNA-uridine aminocarboxypropyltransferase [Shewanella]MPY24144.1 DTW domain-containing protein [Shewanella sp. YLB-07]QDO84374.1 DTW domain-containing protein [Shewanella psychropiezotolerans]
MNLVLLTHQREVDRPTNTGLLALNAFPQWCRRIIWSRVSPDLALIELIRSHRAAVLFPRTKDLCLSEGSCDPDGKDGPVPMENTQAQLYLEHMPDTLIILDATWQEARKMMRQSPYLKAADKFALTEQADSGFTLRRNQIEGGLCTLECIIGLLELKNHHEEAELLKQALIDFQAG